MFTWSRLIGLIDWFIPTAVESRAFGAALRETLSSPFFRPSALAIDRAISLS